MSIGLVGRKCGITQLFSEEGCCIPITLIEVLPNRITQIKTEAKEGYKAIQVTTGQRSVFRLSKPQAGHFVKAGVEAGYGLWEFRLDEQDSSDLTRFSLGQELTVELFKPGQRVDITGTSKGKGYSGVIKRHHFATQDASHGNSLSHRAPGSIGQRQSPGRVFKGKKMAGQLGNHRCTMQSLEVVRVEAERHLLLIKGSIPGATGGRVIIKPAVRLNKKDTE